jgi:murein DD-endopeptidase MepM/ murein hydrolase activator NlpD
VQGRTGQLTIGMQRPLSLTASWNGLPLPLLATNADGTEQAALLPVPALLAPIPYTLTIGYTTTSGILLRQDRLIQVVEGPYESQEILLPDDKGGLLAPELVETELAQMIEAWSQVTPTWWWREPFTRPISSQYATTSPFGTRRSYNGGPYSSYHAGQDYGAPEGVPILAPAAGRVALAAPLQVRGNAVLLDHGGGIYTGYWHMSELYVNEGQMVNVGDVLGLVGTTGLSTGAHLHWELRIYGIAVDPLQFLTDPLLIP